MSDHYATLGVARTATPDEIKRAFRKLASQHHPDRVGGDTAKFQSIQAAYDTLGDAVKRAEYDNPRPQFSGFPGGAQFNMNDIFGQMFGQGFGQQRRQQPNFVRMTLWIRLHDVAQGGNRPVAVGTAQGQQTIEVEIPLGINDGDSVQYQGLAPGGQDLVIQYRIHPDPQWQRDGLNMICERSVTVRTITGTELVTGIPARTQPRTMLRLRGQGLRDRSGNQGDLLVRVMPEVPADIRPELLEAIEKYRK
jgi:DnaJ-class molecular chaperone